MRFCRPAFRAARGVFFTWPGLFLLLFFLARLVRSFGILMLCAPFFLLWIFTLTHELFCFLPGV